MGEVGLHAGSRENTGMQHLRGISDEMVGQNRNHTWEALAGPGDPTCHSGRSGGEPFYKATKGRETVRVADGAVVCAGQRTNQEGSSPSGVRMRGAISKGGDETSLGLTEARQGRVSTVRWNPKGMRIALIIALVHGGGSITQSGQDSDFRPGKVELGNWVAFSAPYYQYVNMVARSQEPQVCMMSQVKNSIIVRGTLQVRGETASIRKNICEGLAMIYNR